MPSKKPLKAFISYSHKDATLCQAFLTHIKPLVKEGIIAVWHDKEIPAGAKWNDSIRRKLADADLFIALVSADYNASEYVENEIQVAQQRSDEGKCCILAITVRNCRRNTRLSRYQFLYGPEQTVSGAANQDDVWAVIVDGLEKAATEPVADSTIAGRKQSPLDSRLPYLCNWREPIRKLDSLRAPAPLRPSIVILTGTKDDCHDRFIDRIATRHLPEILALVRTAEPEVKRFDWMETFDDEIHDALESKPGMPLDKKLRPGLTVLNTTVSGTWTHAKEQLLERFLKYWRTDWGPLPRLRALVCIVSIVFPSRDPEFVARIETLVQRERDAGLPAVTIELPEVRCDHAVNWPGDREVKARYRREAELELREEIGRLFTPSLETMPMRALAPKLMELIERYR